MCSFAYLYCTCMSIYVGSHMYTFMFCLQHVSQCYVSMCSVYIHNVCVCGYMHVHIYTFIHIHVCAHVLVCLCVSVGLSHKSEMVEFPSPWKLEIFVILPCSYISWINGNSVGLSRKNGSRNLTLYLLFLPPLSTTPLT